MVVIAIAGDPGGAEDARDRARGRGLAATVVAPAAAPGRWLVVTGRYASNSEATDAARTISRRYPAEYPGAHVEHVAP